MKRLGTRQWDILTSLDFHGVLSTYQLLDEVSMTSSCLGKVLASLKYNKWIKTTPKGYVITELGRKLLG